MILIYFNSKNNNNLLVSPLYSKLRKKYSDLIRFLRHYLHEWHSFNIYGSSANVAHITEKMQCDHSFSGNGFRWLKFTSALGLVKGDKKSGNGTSTTCTEDDNTNLLGNVKTLKKWGKGILVLPQTKRNSTEKQILHFCRFSMKMTKFSGSCHPRKIFIVIFRWKGPFDVLRTKKKIYIYIYIYHHSKFAVCNGKGRGIDFPTIWKLLMRICMENQWAVTG